MKRLLTGLSVCWLAGCGGSFESEGAQDCGEGATVLAVSVVDHLGNPVSGAQVRGSTPNGDRVLYAWTNGNGVSTAFRAERYAPGQVQVSARLYNLETESGIAQWTCGNCGCVVSPPKIELTLAAPEEE